VSGAPEIDDLRPIADELGLKLSNEDLGSYAALLGGLWPSLDELTAVHEREVGRPAMPERSWQRPSHAENPYGAWQCLTSIRSGSEGRLAGLRVAIKDNVCVAGVPMDNGSSLLQGYVPDRDATVVTRLLDAGAEIAGKAVCEDSCLAASSDTAITGPVLNPWDTEHCTGGSSSGCGALLAAGGVDLAVGADQGGSIRMPAGWCGVVGLKPTYGLVPYTGAVSMDIPIDHLGPMARTTREIAVLLEVLAGPDGLDPRQPPSLVGQRYEQALTGDCRGLRIGVVREGFGVAGQSEEVVDDAIRSALERLAEAGAVVGSVSVPEHRIAADIVPASMLIGVTSQLLTGNGASLNHPGPYDLSLMRAVLKGRRGRAAELAPTVKMALLGGSYLLAADGGMAYATAQNLVPWLRASYDRALADHDVLVMPTQPMRATRIIPPDAPLIERVVHAMTGVANTAQFNVTGHPALSVPAALIDGLPIGMMVIGARGQDATVLRAADAWEQVRGPFPTPPKAA
jgi:amidase